MEIKVPEETSITRALVGINTSESVPEMGVFTEGLVCDIVS